MAAEYKETVARRYYTVTGEKPEDSTIEALISSGESESFLQKAIQEQGRGQVMDTISEIQERHDAVKDIERSDRYHEKVSSARILESGRRQRAWGSDGPRGGLRGPIGVVLRNQRACRSRLLSSLARRTEPRRYHRHRLELGHAREALGLSAYKAGNMPQAKQWFQQIANDAGAPRNVALQRRKPPRSAGLYRKSRRTARFDILARPDIARELCGNRQRCNETYHTTRFTSLPGTTMTLRTAEPPMKRCT